MANMAMRSTSMRKARAFIVDDEPSGLNSPRGGRLGAASTVTATNVKSEFGRVLEKVIQGGIVVITSHDEPKAVLISGREFHALTSANRIRLGSVIGEFDHLVAVRRTRR